MSVATHRHLPVFKTRFSTRMIEERVRALGREVTTHYRRCEEPLIVVGILTGSFVFLADLVRHIHVPVQVEFMGASSYGNETTSSGDVSITRLRGFPGRWARTNATGRHVLVVEDILDTGRTLQEIQRLIEKEDPSSVEVCTLLNKHREDALAEAKWVGFRAPDEFLVGYGLDHAGQYRNLPSIGVIST